MRALATQDDCRMFLLIPFLPAPALSSGADDLVWIRVCAALRRIRTVGKELSASHALGNGITINRRGSRGCEPASISAIRARSLAADNGADFRAAPIDYRETPRICSETRPRYASRIAIKKLSRFGQEQRPLFLFV